MNGSDETLTDIAQRFGVSRGWIYKRVMPVVPLFIHIDFLAQHGIPSKLVLID